MKVLKFGGTSVGSPKSIKEVASIVSNIEGPKIVVLSAMSQTTNVLHQITDHIGNGAFDEAKEVIAMLIARYKDVVENLFESKEYTQQASAFVEERFDFIGSYAHEGSVDVIAAIERIIVAQGEILSTNLFTMYMNEIKSDVQLLSAFDFMRIDPKGEPDAAYITESLGEIIKANATTELFVTQGYICLSHDGEIDNLKRGGERLFGLFDWRGNCS